MLRKIASVFTILVFVLSGPQTSLAQTAGKPEGLSSANVETQVPPIHKKILEPARPAMLPEKNPYFITVPETSGSIEEVFQGSSDQPLVVHIQNVHANYEAQVNIKNILNHLARNFGFSLIQLEGAVSRLDPDILKPSYLEEANLKLADFLMREGRITGADAFAVETNLPVELYGIEDPALYMENLRMFRSIYAHREAVDGFFKNIYELIDRVGRAMLTPGQLDFTRKKDVFARDRIDLLDYLMFLNQVSESLSLTSLKDLKNMAEYPNLVRIRRLHDLEASLDQAKLKKEGEDLKAAFLKALPDSGLPAELLSKLEEKEKGLRPRDYFLKLTDLAEEAGISFAGFPQIRAYAEYSIYQDEIDHRALFPELKNFESYLEAALFKTEDEKTLLAAISRANLLEQYFKLEMSREKLALYVRDSVELKPTLVASALKGLAEKYSVNFPLDVDAASLDAHMKDLEYYYRLVLKRDEVFFGNIMSRLRESGKDKTILVTGGFHKEGLVEQYRRKNISYVIVSPNVDVAAGNENYVKVMMGEDAVVGSVFAGSFAVEVPNVTLWQAFGLKGLYARLSAATAALTLHLSKSAESFTKAWNERQERLAALLEKVKAKNAYFAGNLAVVEAAAGRAELRAEYNGKTEKFRVVAIKEVRGQAVPTLEPQAVTGLPDLTQLETTEFSLPPKTQEAANEINPEEFLPQTPMDTYIPAGAGLGAELNEALLKAASGDVEELRSEARKGTVISLDIVKKTAGSTRVVSARQIANASVDERVSEEAFNFLNGSNVSQPTLLLSVLNFQENTEASRAEAQALYSTLQANSKLVAVVYAPTGVREFLLDALKTGEKALSEAPLDRLLLVDKERTIPVSTYDEAVDLAAKALTVKPAALLDYLRKHVEGAGSISIAELEQAVSVLIPPGRAGERMNLTISGSLATANIKRIYVRETAQEKDAVLKRAIKYVEVNLGARLTSVEAEMLRRLFPDVIEQVSSNAWQVANTEAAIAMIRALYENYLQVSIAA